MAEALTGAGAHFKASGPAWRQERVGSRLAQFAPGRTIRAT